MKKTTEDILAELTPIFCDVFELDDVTLTLETTANDIEAWDSLAHIQLIMALGSHFNVRFSSQEIIGWKSVADIVASIQAQV